MKRQPEALFDPHLWQHGIGHVVVVRYKQNGNIEAGVFLLDVWCLGVKDAFFFSGGEEEFQSRLLDKIFQDDYERGPAARGRKLVEDCVAHARNLGFAPHADFKKGCRVFGGIDPSECDEKFSFGKDGKPFYVAGQYETPEKSRRIISILRAKCGEDGFHFIMPFDHPEDDGDFDPDDMDANAEEGLTLFAAEAPESDEPSPELEKFALEKLEEDDRFTELEILWNEPDTPATLLLALAENIARTDEGGDDDVDDIEEEIEAAVGQACILFTLISVPPTIQASMIDALPSDSRDFVRDFLASDSAREASARLAELRSDATPIPVIVDWRVLHDGGAYRLQVLFAEPPVPDENLNPQTG